jgi:hypothetical protein
LRLVHYHVLTERPDLNRVSLPLGQSTHADLRQTGSTGLVGKDRIGGKGGAAIPAFAGARVGRHDFRWRAAADAAWPDAPPG